MIVLPAIDLMEGKVVRLRRGNFAERTVFSDDPLAVAERMVGEGASWLHVIDLDGAREGRPFNLHVVSAIAERFPVKIQFGGGIRSVLQIDDALGAGAARVILSTRVFTDEEFLYLVCESFQGVIAISIDAAGGTVRVAGWEREAPLTVSEAVSLVEEAGGELLIFTDIEADGTNAGVNLDHLDSLLDHTRLPVIYAGGVSSLDDLAALSALEPRGLAGAIVGRAYYDGLIDLRAAIARFHAREEGG